MQITDPVLLNKIAEWRRKSTDGSISLDEMREAIKALRQNRLATAEAAKASKSKSTKAPPKDAGTLLSELDGL